MSTSGAAKTETMVLSRFTRAAQRIVAAAQKLADELRHDETTPLHVLSRLVELPPVREALAQRGVQPEEAAQRCLEALAELPTGEEEAGVSAALLALLRRLEAEAGEERVDCRRLAEALAGAEGLPMPQLRRDVAGAVAALGAALEVPEAPGSSTGTIQLEGYSAAARSVVAGAQKLADEMGHAEITPAHVLLKIIEMPAMVRVIERRGGDHEAAYGRCLAALGAMARGQPAYVSAGLLEVLERAERNAKAEAGEVTLAHLTAAMREAGDAICVEVLDRAFAARGGA